MLPELELGVSYFVRILLDNYGRIIGSSYFNEDTEEYNNETFSLKQEVNALINSFSEQIEKARAFYIESRDIKNKATEIRKEGFDTKESQEEFNNLIVESNKKLQGARDAVTEAHKTLAEIITKILKVYNGKLPETTTAFG